MATAPKLWGKQLGRNVAAGLDDIQILAKMSREAIAKSAKHAAKHNDTATLATLVEIQSNLAEIERLAYQAKQGRYDG